MYQIQCELLIPLQNVDGSAWAQYIKSVCHSLTILNSQEKCELEIEGPKEFTVVHLKCNEDEKDLLAKYCYQYFNQPIAWRNERKFEVN